MICINKPYRCVSQTFNRATRSSSVSDLCSPLLASGNSSCVLGSNDMIRDAAARENMALRIIRSLETCENDIPA